MRIAEDIVVALLEWNPYEENQLKGLSVRAANMVLRMTSDYITPYGQEAPAKPGGWPAALQHLASMSAKDIFNYRNMGANTYYEIYNWLQTMYGVSWPNPYQIGHADSRGKKYHLSRLARGMVGGHGEGI